MLGKFKRTRHADGDFLTRAIEDAVLDQPRKGLDPERVGDLISTAVPDVINELAPQLAAAMIKDKRTLRANKLIDRRFDRRLQKKWSKALDLYRVLHSVCVELGEREAHKKREILTPAQEHTLEALTGLHVTACRIAGEVLTLLSHGHPRGAMARCRTLHETAVIACVIADAAADPDHHDLAERFLDHEIVGLRRDALQFQRDHATLGEEPLEQAYVDELEKRYTEVLAKYGQSFKRDYGWAKRFSPDDNLRKLEEKTSLSHVRPYYQWASSEVHCGARGLGRNFIEYRGLVLRDAGKVNVGLVDPAIMALNSLIQVSFSLAVSGAPEGPDIEALLCVRAIEEMRSTCSCAFEDAQVEIDRAEERIVKRMQRKNVSG
ncbi:DUF5677 domain-containing protein [Streptomyces sp. Tu 6176]|uniref:DUF5677 domain-containing protein n=1 Tax=Streptomyces sp. Tu 6176 TaxID=1470557 RepID=UPI00131A1E11|nr:DUF5677 domain-containing protein [Streptomyces sp. Tu 6176]